MVSPFCRIAVGYARAVGRRPAVFRIPDAEAYRRALPGRDRPQYRGGADCAGAWRAPGARDPAFLRSAEPAAGLRNRALAGEAGAARDYNVVCRTRAPARVEA